MAQQQQDGALLQLLHAVERGSSSYAEWIDVLRGRTLIVDSCRTWRTVLTLRAKLEARAKETGHEDCLQDAFMDDC